MSKTYPDRLYFSEGRIRISRKTIERLFAAERRLPSFYLASVPTFAGLGQTVLQELDLESNRVRLAAGQIRFNQGNAPDYLYVVVQGRLEVSHNATAPRPSTVDQLGHGACVVSFGTANWSGFRTATPAAAMEMLRPTDCRVGAFRVGLLSEIRALIQSGQDDFASRLVARVNANRARCYYVQALAGIASRCLACTVIPFEKLTADQLSLAPPEAERVMMSSTRPSAISS